MRLAILIMSMLQMRKMKRTERLRNMPKGSRLVRTIPQDFKQGTTPELNFNRPNGWKRSHYKTMVATPGGSYYSHTGVWKDNIGTSIIFLFVLAHPFVKCLFLHVIKCT